MLTGKRKYIGDTCYICLSSKAELVRADESLRIPLSVTEYKILSYFIDHLEVPVYLEELAQHIWGPHADEKDPNSLKSQISRVRGKLDKIRNGLRSCIDTNHGLNSYTMSIAYPQAAVVVGNIHKKAKSSASVIREKLFPFVLTRLHNGEAIVLRDGLTLMGRNRIKCTYCVTDNPAISHIHAAIYVKSADLVTIQDMNSMTGTYLNQRRLPPLMEFTMQIGDKISLANEDFLLLKASE